MTYSVLGSSESMTASRTYSNVISAPLVQRWHPEIQQAASASKGSSTRTTSVSSIDVGVGYATGANLLGSPSQRTRVFSRIGLSQMGHSVESAITNSDMGWLTPRSSINTSRKG